MRNRDGKETVCVVCADKIPLKKEEPVKIKNAEQSRQTVTSDNSAHIQLLEQAAIAIFDSLDFHDTDKADQIAVDLLNSLRVLSGGRV